MVYADSSALVKAVVLEDETAALGSFLARRRPHILTSKLAVVEVTRAGRVAGSSSERDAAVAALLASCELVEVTEDIVTQAALLVTELLRSLDAIHLATALHVRVDDMIVYDRHLADAAREAGIAVHSPGA